VLILFLADEWGRQSGTSAFVMMYGGNWRYVCWRRGLLFSCESLSVLEGRMQSENVLDTNKFHNDL
jgi:hypothetical protein